MFVETLKTGRYRAGFTRPKAPGETKQRKVTRTFDSVREARAWATEAEAEAHGLTTEVPEPEPTEAPVGPQQWTVREAAADWFARRAGLRKATRDYYATALGGLNTETKTRTGGRVLFDSLRFTEVSRADVQRWLVTMEADGVNAGAYNQRLKVLRMIYTDAMAAAPADRLTNYDPTHGLKRRPSPTTPGHVVSHVEEARILAAAEQDRDLRLMILLGLDCGLRFSEVAGLCVDAVDLTEGVLYVRRTVDRTTGLLTLDTKSHRGREVPLGHRLPEELGTVLAEAQLARGPHGLLFANRAGNPVDYHRFRRARFLPVARLVDPVPTFHDLRHTYATRVALAGCPVSELALLLGHSDLKQLERYVHGSTRARRAGWVAAALPQPVMGSGGHLRAVQP